MEDWDEASVETVEHDYPENTRTPKPVHNIFNNTLNLFLSYLSNPWALLLLIFLLYHLYRRHLAPYSLRIHRFFSNLRDKEHKESPEIFRAKQEQLAMARAELQSKYDEEARLKSEEMRAKEELRRRQKLELDEAKAGLKGQRLLGNQNNNKSNTWRPDYNPLAPGGGGSSYRPERRRPCGGGGCG